MARGVRTFSVPQGSAKGVDMSGFGVALAALIGKLKKDKENRKLVAAMRAYAKALEDGRAKGMSRRDAVDIPIPKILQENPKGLEMSRGFLNELFPTSENPKVSWFNKDGDFIQVGRWNDRPEGGLTREEILTKRAAKDTGKGGPNLAKKKYEIIEKAFANRRAIDAGRRPPFKILQEEYNLVADEIGDRKSFSDAMRIAIDSERYWRVPAPTEDNPNAMRKTTPEERTAFVEELTRGGKNLRDTLQNPPGVTGGDVDKTWKVLKQKYPTITRDEVLDKLWEQYENGRTDFTATRGFSGQGRTGTQAGPASPTPTGTGAGQRQNPAATGGPGGGANRRAPDLPEPEWPSFAPSKPDEDEFYKALLGR